MQPILRHLTKHLIAGIVALLPIGGTILGLVYIESSLAQTWLRKEPFYFPGLGILLAAAMIYGVGLLVSTFVGRWLWRLVDRILDRLPVLGGLYQTLKQILGYGEGKQALFERVVLVEGERAGARELGLVTQTIGGPNAQRLVVFVPSAPNPTAGRLLVVDAARTLGLDMSVKDAMTALVALGKTESAEALAVAAR